MAEIDGIENLDELRQGLPNIEQIAQQANQPTNEGVTIDPVELQRLRQANEVVERFNRDPHQVMQQLAAQMGMQIVSQNQPQQQVEPATPKKDSEWDFLNDHINGLVEDRIKAVINEHVAPVLQNQQQLNARAMQEQSTRAVTELANEHPDWQKYESEMTELLRFMKDAVSGTGTYTHPKFGNILKILYNQISGKDRAVAELAQRWQEAPLQSAPSSNDSGGSIDIVKMIKDEPDTQRKWELAISDSLRGIQ